MANREELRSLDLANKIYDQKVNITRAGFLPTVALTANYMVTNPSLVNGFERKFRGMWAVGAMVQIPIWNWGEGMYKVKRLPKRKQTLPAINWQMQRKGRIAGKPSQL